MSDNRCEEHSRTSEMFCHICTIDTLRTDLRKEHDTNAILTRQVETLQDQVDGYKDDYRAAYSAPCADEKHCTCVPGLTKRAEVAESQVETLRGALGEINLRSCCHDGLKDGSNAYKDSLEFVKWQSFEALKDTA